MNKSSFNKLGVKDQVKYFNLQLNNGNNIGQICQSINISYSTIRDRFKRNNYVYNKIYNKYENLKYMTPNEELSDELISTLISKINSKQTTLDCEERNSNLTSRSFRVHSCVLDDFIKFCKNSHFTQQEIITQFIAEGLNKYNEC